MQIPSLSNSSSAASGIKGDTGYYGGSFMVNQAKGLSTPLVIGAVAVALLIWRPWRK